MKKRVIGAASIGIAVVALVTATMAFAAQPIPPQLGPVGVRLPAFTLTGTAPTTTTCNGSSSNFQYVTAAGASWTGTITDGSLMHVYNLSGQLTLDGSMVFDTNTGSGVFRGTMTLALSTPGIGATRAEGPVTLVVSNRIPVSNQYEGRGMVIIPFYAGKKLTDTSLIANVEFTIDPTLTTFNGTLGYGNGLTPALDDGAVEWNGQVCQT